MHEELIKSILDRIESELERCYWNKNHKEMLSPFKNTGETYKNDLFVVRAYSWSDDENEWIKPNFESDFMQCWWYKHSHRGLRFNIFWPEMDGKDSLDKLANFLNKCIESIRKDFGEIKDEMD